MAGSTRARVVRTANKALADLSAARAELEKISAVESSLFAEIRKHHQARIDELGETVRQAEDLLAKLWQDHGDELRDSSKSKTATLRNGTLSERLGVATVVLGERSRVLRYLRRRRATLRFTKKSEPEISKAKLKMDPKFVDGAPDEIMHFEKVRTLYIRPVDASTEGSRVLGTEHVRLTDASN